MTTRMRGLALAGVSAAVLIGCGGGGGGGGTPNPPAPAPTYTVGVTVSGLAGSGLVLRNNGGDNLTVSANGNVNFATALNSGGAYAVTVATQPSSPTQTCAVTNGSGTIAGANVTNVAIACTTNRYSVSASVNGATGSGLLLMLGTEELPFNGNSPVTFPTQLDSGSNFDVRVARQPISPRQRCTVTGGSGQVTNASINVSVQCTTEVPRFAYTLDWDNASVSTYLVDATSGQLRPRGHVRTGLKPAMIFPDPQQRFWFTLNQGDATLSVFSQDAVTAALTEVPGSPYATGGTGGDETVAPSHVVIHPSGKFVYVVNGSGTDNVAAFSVDPNSGALTAVPGSPFAGGSDPYYLRFDAAGRFAYLSNRGSGDIYMYRVNATTGALAQFGSPVASGNTPGLLKLTSNERFAYITNSGSNTIAAFSVNATTGALTPIAGSPYPTGPNPAFLTYLHPSDKFLYVHGRGATDAIGNVSAFKIDQSTGALTLAGTPPSVGANSTRAVIDPSGNYLFISNRGTPLGMSNVGSVSEFRIDQTTGELTALAGIPGVEAFAVEADPSGKFVYVTSVITTLHRTYALDSVSGALTLASSGPFVSTRKSPLGLSVYSSIRTPAAASFTSKFAFVANGGEQTINSYSINSGSGSFALVNSLTTTQGNPRSVAVHPSGRYLLASHPGNIVGLASYPIDAGTGALSPAAGTMPTGAGMGTVIASPNGRNAYVVDGSHNLILAFGIDANGAFSSINQPYFNALSTTTPALGMAIAPNGRFMHYINASDRGAGELEPVMGSFVSPASSTGTTGQLTLAIHPQGQFVYIARDGTPNGTVETWQMNWFGFLQQVGSAVPAGLAPSAIAIEPTGRYLYVLNTGSNNLSQYAIDRIAGTLTELPPAVAAGTAPVSVATDYSGKYVYVLSQGTSQLLTFVIDQAIGHLTLSAVTPATTGAGATQIVVSSDVN